MRPRQQTMPETKSSEFFFFFEFRSKNVIFSNQKLHPGISVKIVELYQTKPKPQNIQIFWSRVWSVKVDILKLRKQKKNWQKQIPQNALGFHVLLKMRL